MSSQIPDLLLQYFAAQNAHDIEAMVACFAPDATVHDEGHDMVGTEAIRAWIQDTSARYQVSVEPLESLVEESRTLVSLKVTGTFPGSPANITFSFRFNNDGRIGALDIG